MPIATLNTGISSHQAGAALFMALIFLLILTVLGVFGMNMSRLENMMAGNNQFQTLALGNAELTVDAAEHNLEYMLTKGTKDTCYFPKATLVDPSPLNWPISITDVACSYTPPKGSNGRYIVEYVGNGIDDDCGKGLGKGESKAGCIHYDFLVTAQADASRGARRTVQTVYQSGTAP